MIKEKWYLLYGGSSEDGRGPGRYEGRTVDHQEALLHFIKVKSSPYSTGRVLVITDDQEIVASRERDFS